MDEDWNYRGIVGMCLYLCTNTRPDITFSVSQVTCFGNSPKKSHATAVKMILRYLKRTEDKGLIIKPNGTLQIDAFVDADFAGLHHVEPDSSPNAARSRIGYIIKLGGCPLLWRSQLASCITLSTLESEYYGLQSLMRVLLPLYRMLVEAAERVNLDHEVRGTIHGRVWEDNNGALLLATNQRITNRTKYFLTAWHWFWSHVYQPAGPDGEGNPTGEFHILKVASEEQEADYLTKGLSREVFEIIRKLVQGW